MLGISQAFAVPFGRMTFSFGVADPEWHRESMKFDIEIPIMIVINISLFCCAKDDRCQHKHVY